MIPSAFEQANCNIDTPAGSSPDDIEPIVAYRGEMTDGRPCIVTCWRPTQHEVAEIQRTGRVWVTVLGHRLVPMALHGECPFDDGAEMLGDS